HFFDFLNAFARSTINLKLLIALRTEHFGRFSSKLSRVGYEGFPIQQYLLEDLSKDSLITAIKRPTSAEPSDDYGSPRDVYQFVYEEGLPEKIADELKSPYLNEGALPVMQILCSRLYEKTKERAKRLPWVITFSDYNELGDAQKRIETQ